MSNAECPMWFENASDPIKKSFSVYLAIPIGSEKSKHRTTKYKRGHANRKAPSAPTREVDNEQSPYSRVNSRRRQTPSSRGDLVLSS